mmetsp:Transcript_2431/g.8426  ORF Transcript_2431/g.8426 Transcript_2431/m.8426 type:complete len:259 (+) Transcript_2431:3194-3970(+)
MTFSVSVSVALCFCFLLGSKVGVVSFTEPEAALPTRCEPGTGDAALKLTSASSFSAVSAFRARDTFRSPTSRELTLSSKQPSARLKSRNSRTCWCGIVFASRAARLTDAEPPAYDSAPNCDCLPIRLSPGAAAGVCVFTGTGVGTTSEVSESSAFFSPTSLFPILGTVPCECLGVRFQTAAVTVCPYARSTIAILRAMASRLKLSAPIAAAARRTGVCAETSLNVDSAFQRVNSVLARTSAVAACATGNDPPGLGSPN